MCPGRAEPGDPVGAATLERMAAAPRYNRWMFERLRPWIGRRVLEIGAGIGNMSAFLLDRERLILTDSEGFYLDRLRDRFAGRPQIKVAPLRLPAFDPALAAERLDTVVCLNVLEHIEDDRASLRAIRDLLAPGGWLAGRVLRRRLIPTGALRWYEALVPLFRLERLLPWRIGQSLIAIGEVPA